MTTQKIAVVTGANRGLGFETSRQLAKQGYKVILTSRNQAKGKTATEQLQSEGLDIIFHALDVTSDDSVRQLADFIGQQFGHLHVLVNNAGVFLDFQADSTSVFDAKVDTLRQTMETNVYGVLRVTQALIPLMQKNNYGRIVNVSSGMGQLSGMDGTCTGYRISKTALNALTRILASELSNTNILVNSMCPGWVRTETAVNAFAKILGNKSSNTDISGKSTYPDWIKTYMSGANALRTPEQGVDTIVWLATLADGGSTGGFFRDRQPIDW